MIGFMAGIRWRSFKNTSGETIPAHSIIRADNGDTDSLGKVWIVAAKPNASAGFTSDLFVTGPLDVPDGGWGVCTDDQIVPVQFDTGGGTPASGDTIGPKSGQWTAYKGNDGAKCLTLNDSSETIRVAWINRSSEGCSPGNSIHYWTLAGLPSGGTFTVKYITSLGTSTSAAIARNASAATIQTALEAMTAIGSGNVTVTGGPINGANIACEFIAGLANENIALPIFDWTSVTGGSGVGMVAWWGQVGR